MAGRRQEHGPTASHSTIHKEHHWYPPQEPGQWVRWVQRGKRDGKTQGHGPRGCRDGQRPLFPLDLREGAGPEPSPGAPQTCLCSENPELFIACYHPPGIICVTISFCKVYESSCKIPSISSPQLGADYFPA